MKHSVAILFFLILFGVASCTCRKQTTVTGNTLPEVDEIIPAGMEKMVVVDSRLLDGCQFLLVSNDSIYFDPGTLNQEFCVNGLQVYVKYKPDKNRMSICMRGQQITITEIKLAGK